MSTSFDIDNIRSIVVPIAKKYGVARVYLFGSVARGEANENSDVDLRIDSGDIKSLFALSGFYADIEDALGKPIDVLTTKSLSTDFLNEIKNEEILLYEKE